MTYSSWPCYSLTDGQIIIEQYCSQFFVHKLSFESLNVDDFHVSVGE